MSVIIPAYNEEAAIGAVVTAVARLPKVAEVIVVDDGSVDETAAVARRAGARVLRMRRNRGKAEAMREGFNAAGGDIVTFVDADLGASAANVERLFAPVVTDAADMTLGRLPRGGKRRGGLGLVVGFAQWAVRRHGGSLEVPLSGQRVCRREILESLSWWGHGFGVEMAITLHALQIGCRIQEVDIPVEHRLTGWDPNGISHRAKQLRDMAWTLWRLSLHGRWS